MIYHVKILMGIHSTTVTLNEEHKIIDKAKTVRLIKMVQELMVLVHTVWFLNSTQSLYM